jgi:hypothetical protein
MSICWFPDVTRLLMCFSFVKTDMGNAGARGLGMEEAFTEISDSVGPIVEVVSTTRSGEVLTMAISQYTDCIYRSIELRATRRGWSFLVSMARCSLGNRAYGIRGTLSVLY